MKLLFLGLFFSSYTLKKLLSFNASHPIPQTPSVGCKSILPSANQSADEKTSKELLCNYELRALSFLRTSSLILFL